MNDNRIRTIVLIILAIMTLFIGAKITLDNEIENQDCQPTVIQSHYYIDGTVNLIAGSEIHVIDNCGQEWIFYGVGYQTGETVRLKMLNTVIEDATVIEEEGL